MPCIFKNYHFLSKKLDKLVFHKILKDFFRHFPNTTVENTLLICDTPHKSMLNTPCNAIFFKTFYGFHIEGNYLFRIVFPYLESLYSSGMQVYKFVELNPFSSITKVPLGDPWYLKLNVCCFAKCDETFCNKVKLKFVTKKR